MRYLILIPLLTMSLLVMGCARKEKQDTPDLRCQRFISQAEEVYAKEAKSRDKVLAEQVANLITAAKIDREHKDYAQCIDKSSRAIKLLDPNALLSLGKQN